MTRSTWPIWWSISWRTACPRRFGLDPRRDVQVLCPMHRGPAGAGVLNERLQEALTPARPGVSPSGV